MQMIDWGVFRIHVGDCVEAMKGMAAESVDSIVTDPPYGLTSARPSGRSEATRGAVMGGFMGLAWDGDVPDTAVWREAHRVLKPGGFLLAFFGTRTYHRGVTRIEDAGFEVRDQIGWTFGSGFPKSHNGPWGGTALKPAWEPIAVARKPLSGTVEENWRLHGTGALNIGACRIPTADKLGGGAETLGRWPANLIHDGSDEVLEAFPSAPRQRADVKTSGESKTRRVFNKMRRGEASADSPNNGVVGFAMKPGARRFDSGSAARFFYCAKASNADRGPDNAHPTVKPTDLMRYLVRLVTPPGGVVLDPFAGSGSTGKAAVLEGFTFVGCEREQEYVDIAVRRISTALFGANA